MKKAEQISELRPTPSRQKMLKIFNYLSEICNELKTGDKQPDTAGTPDLETEESARKSRNQRGQGLKILTPSQMLSRLTIALAQLKAGNNSEKLKNEIRQLLYSLYR